MSEETQFEDAESYNYSFDKNKLTFKDIILLHLKKIGDYASVEFRGGYWEVRSKVIGGMGIEDKHYIPDTREVYTNSINYLADTLYPYFDEEMKKAFEKAEKETEKAYNDNTVEVEPDREDQNPEEAKKYRKFKNLSDKRSYRSEKTEINRKLFRALCCFLYRRKYLELGSIED